VHTEGFRQVTLSPFMQIFVWNAWLCQFAWQLCGNLIYKSYRISLQCLIQSCVPLNPTATPNTITWVHCVCRCWDHREIISLFLYRCICFSGKWVIPTWIFCGYQILWFSNALETLKHFMSKCSVFGLSGYLLLKSPGTFCIDYNDNEAPSRWTAMALPIGATWCEELVVQ
jgi:hypothetical protein